MKQGSEEWFAARVGKLTASRFADILSGPESRKKYACETIQELVTGEPVTDQFVTVAMEWGNQYEPLAAIAYQEKFPDKCVLPCGFISHPDYSFVGVSPDRLIGFDGLLEIKCPYYTYNHVKAIYFSAYEKHKAQVQGQLWVTEREWCDLVSFDPRYTEQPLHVETIYRDEDYIAQLEKEVTSFWECISTRNLADIAKPKRHKNQT